MTPDDGMKKLARENAAGIWYNYAKDFAVHMGAGNLTGQCYVFTRYMEELKFLFSPNSDDDDLLEIALEASNVGPKVPATIMAVEIWGRFLLKYSKYERKKNVTKMYRVYSGFIEELRASLPFNLPEDDLLEIAEHAKATPDPNSPVGAMSDLLAEDDSFIGVLDVKPMEPTENVDAEPAAGEGVSPLDEPEEIENAIGGFFDEEEHAEEFVEDGSDEGEMVEDNDPTDFSGSEPETEPEEQQEDDDDGTQEQEPGKLEKDQGEERVEGESDEEEPAEDEEPVDSGEGEPEAEHVEKPEDDFEDNGVVDLGPVEPEEDR